MTGLPDAEAEDQRQHGNGDEVAANFGCSGTQIEVVRTTWIRIKKLK
jgi:hypothetical protein